MPPNFLLLLTKIQWFHFPATVELFLHSTAAGRKPCLHPRCSPLCSLQLLFAMWVSIQTLASAAWDLLRAWGPTSVWAHTEVYSNCVQRSLEAIQGFKTYRGNPQLIRDRRCINTPAFPPLGRTTLSCVLYSVPWGSQENPNLGGNSLTACLFPHSVTCASWDQYSQQTSCTPVFVSVLAFRGTVQMRMDAKE